MERSNITRLRRRLKRKFMSYEDYDKSKGLSEFIEKKNKFEKEIDEIVDDFVGKDEQEKSELEKLKTNLDLIISSLEEFRINILKIIDHG